jgi:hypothetical protein
MPGFKGKRKRGLTLTLYKKPFRYRLPVSTPRKRTKTSSSTPNLKSPSTRTPSILIRVLISFMLKSVNLSILQKTINKTTSKSPHAFAMCSITTDLLKQENEEIDSL